MIRTTRWDRTLCKRQKGGKLTDVNENLACEVMELHTLGVGGPYSHGDVRELAELLTGVTVTKPMRLNFRKNISEPGSETVLGQTYRGDNANINDVKSVLRDLARKLAVHFISDTPDPALITALEARFLATGGDLAAVTEALLTHPAAWAPARQNVKPAFHYVASALRADLGWILHSQFGLPLTALERDVFPNLDMGADPKLLHL